jgi:hypothetical protein
MARQEINSRLRMPCSLLWCRMPFQRRPVESGKKIEAAAMEASIGWLLNPAAPVRRAVASTLRAARKGKITPTMLRRMITMRNWLPEDSRSALDAAIATARRKGVSPAQWDGVEVRQVVTTGVDGSGAIGVLAHCYNI